MSTLLQTRQSYKLCQAKQDDSYSRVYATTAKHSTPSEMCGTRGGCRYLSSDMERTAHQWTICENSGAAVSWTTSR